MLTRIGLVVGALLCLPVLSGSAQDPKASDIQKLIRRAKILRLQALPGDTVYAGPNATLIDPVTRQPVAKLRLEKPESTCVPVLHQYAKGKYQLYWTLFSKEPTAGRPRKELGDSLDPVVIADDFSRVKDPKKVTIRRTTRGPKTIVREYTSDVLIAYTRHDSGSSLRDSDGKGTQEVTTRDDEGKPIGTSPVAGVSVDGVTMKPNPVVTGTPTTITITFTNSGAPITIVITVSVNPNDGKFSLSGGTKYSETTNLPSDTSSVTLKDTLIPAHSGDVPIVVDFKLAEVKGPVAVPTDTILGPGQNSVFGWSSQPLEGVSGKGTTPDGSTFLIPGKSDSSGDGSSASSSLGGKMPWAASGLFVVPMVIEWIGQPKGGGKDVKWSTVTVTYGEDMESAVDRAQSSITWSPAEETSFQDDPVKTPATDCKYEITSKPGKASSITWTVRTCLDDKFVALVDDNAPGITCRHSKEENGKIVVTFEADGTIQITGKLMTDQNSWTFPAKEFQNAFKKVLVHVVGPKCTDGSPPEATVNADASYTLVLDLTCTSDSFQGTSAKCTLTGQAIVYTQNIGGDYMEQHWFEAKAIDDKPVTWRTAAKVGWSKTAGLDGKKPKAEESQSGELSGSLGGELKWADHDSHSYVVKLAKSGKTDNNGTVGYEGLIAPSLFLNDYTCEFTAKIKYNVLGLIINTECHPHKAKGADK